MILIWIILCIGQTLMNLILTYEEASRFLCAGQTLFRLWPLQQIDVNEQCCCCNCNWMIIPFAVYLSCLVKLFLLLLLWNKHWLFNSKGCSKEYEQKHAFLTDCSTLFKKKSGILVECTGWDHWVKYKDGKCLQVGVMFDQFLPCKNRLVQLDWFLVLCKETKNEFAHLVFNPTFGMGQHYMDTSAPPIFALELAEAIVHIQVKWVYAGAWAPIPESPVRTFSHLSTCEILHTSHNWSMTVSANCIRCFFYMLFTQIIWIIVFVDFGASFLM